MTLPERQQRLLERYLSVPATIEMGERDVLVMIKLDYSEIDAELEKLTIATGFVQGYRVRLLRGDRNQLYAITKSIESGLVSQFHQPDTVNEAINELHRCDLIGQFWLQTKTDYRSVINQSKKWQHTQTLLLQEKQKFVHDLLRAISMADESKLKTIHENLRYFLNQFYLSAPDAVCQYVVDMVNEVNQRGFYITDQQAIEQLRMSLMQSHTIMTLHLTLQEAISLFFERGTSQLSGRNQPLVMRAKQVISERYMFEINNQVLADQLKVSPNYLGAVFKKATGQYLNDYLQDVRMDVAQRLVLEGKQPISAIANAVGIHSQSYFTSVFKDHFGYAPKEYWRRISSQLSD